MDPNEYFLTRTLLAALEQTKPPRTFLRDMFFSNVDTSDSEYIDIDIWKGKRRLAPFVNPRHQGQAVERLGYTTRTYKPPYVKPKMPITADDITARSMGTHMYAGQSPMDRMADKIGRDLFELQEMVVRRVEWMASQALNEGVITVTGEGVEDEIDFQMEASHKITLTGGDLWTDLENSDPLEDLRTWRRRVAQSSGINPDVAVFGSDVVNAFLKHQSVRDALDTRRVDRGVIDLSQWQAIGASYVGNVDGLDIWEYNEWYIDDEDNEQPMVPDDKIFLGSSRARTSQVYGAIRDVEHAESGGDSVGMASVPFFPKSWVEKDPSVRFLMLQSAPLVVPHQIDAFATIKPV